MKPFPIRIVMNIVTTPLHANTAILLALHPQSGGAWKEIHAHREFCEVFDLTSHGRRIYRSLIFTTDSRFSLRDMQPSFKDRDFLWQPWERHAVGHPLQEVAGMANVVNFPQADV